LVNFNIKKKNHNLLDEDLQVASKNSSISACNNTTHTCFGLHRQRRKQHQHSYHHLHKKKHQNRRKKTSCCTRKIKRHEVAINKMNHRNFVTSGGASHNYHIMLSPFHQEARNQATSHQEESDLLHHHHHQQYKSNSCGTAVLDQQYQQLFHVTSTAPGSSSRNNCSDDSIKRGPFDVGERRRCNNMTLQEGESWRLGH